MEDTLYEIESVRCFTGFYGITDNLPDESTILNFRHLLEQHELTTILLKVINAHLKSQGLLVSKSTMVDATRIHALSSTKNREQARDPEMHQTKKEKQWYFGMKVHVGADVDSGAVHTIEITSANEADMNVLPKLLRAEESYFWRWVTPVMNINAGHGNWEYAGVQDKHKPEQNLSGSQKKCNREHSSIRARVKHVFRVIKRQFGFNRTRYRGLMKNTVQVNMLMSLANLYLLRRRLLAT